MPHPTYGQVASKKSGHVECVFVQLNINENNTNTNQEKVGTKKERDEEEKEEEEDEEERMALLYEKVIRLYLDCIDPYDDGGQEQNRGPQYRPVIFWHDQVQRRVALKVLQDFAAKKEREREGLFGSNHRHGTHDTDGGESAAGRWRRPLAVRLRPACVFWEAEEMHQNYYKKNGIDPQPDMPYWMGAFLE